MTIDELQTLLAGLKEKGLSGTTPVVIAIGDEDEDDVELIETENHYGLCVLNNVPYQISSEKMAAIRRNGTVVVIETAMSPHYENTAAGMHYLKGNTNDY